MTSSSTNGLNGALRELAIQTNAARDGGTPGAMPRLTPDMIAGGSGCARVIADELMQVVDFPHLTRPSVFSGKVKI